MEEDSWASGSRHCRGPRFYSKGTGLWWLMTFTDADTGVLTALELERSKASLPAHASQVLSTELTAPRDLDPGLSALAYSGF